MVTPSSISFSLWTRCLRRSTSLEIMKKREKDVLLDAITSVTLSPKAPTMIRQLTDNAQVTAKTLPLSELTSWSGVTNLLREMDKNFGMDIVTLLHKKIFKFFVYNWDRFMSVDAFVVGVHSCLDKIIKLVMKEHLKDHLLLKQASLDIRDRHLVAGVADGKSSRYQSMERLSLRRATVILDAFN